MDLHNIFRYSVPSIETSYDYTSSSLLPDWKLSSVKHEFENSPDSPLTSQIDYDTNSGLSNSQDRNSSSENQSGVNLNNNMPLKTESSYGQAASHHRDNLHLHLDRRSMPQDGMKMHHALQEIESTLMDHDCDEGSSPSSVIRETHQTRSLNQQKQSEIWEKEFMISRPQPSSSGKQRKSYSYILSPRDKRARLGGPSQDSPHNTIKKMLIECARALFESRFSDFENLVQESRNYVSISGDPIQRLGAYMVEGLVARKEESGTNIYRALQCKEPESKDLLSYLQILYGICPYFKFGYMAANGAIAEAFKNEDRVHIIDFQIAQGTQWITLIQALAARPGGPPHVRITGIDDPMSKYARGAGLDEVGKRLAAMSEKFNIPVEFHPMPEYATEVTRDMLDVRPGEAVAVNFTLQLHHTPDEGVDVNNPRDSLLRMVKSLNPKVTTLVEQESNTNTTSFFMRFTEALGYYSAMFESIDVTLPRDSKERIHVEQHCLARDIVNIIACEGKDRVERHELLGKWKLRLSMAGFRPYPLCSYVNSVIRTLLTSYSENYTLVEKEGAMLLGWKDRNLISASAWH